MLTPDLIRARRRSGRLELPPLRPTERTRLLHVAERLLEILKNNPEKPRCEVLGLWDDVEHAPGDFKLIKGLRKLLNDRCTFEPQAAVEPRLLREAVFVRAAASRRALSSGETLDTAAICSLAAQSLEVEAQEVQGALFADLKENHRLKAFDPISPEALVGDYELAQRQAVLLRAVRVVVTLYAPDPGACRRFFQRLKFRRLLYTIERQPKDAWRVEIDGPFSLFKAATRYGMQLALMLPALDEVGAWELDAEIRWGKERAPCQFHLEGGASVSSAERTVRLPDDVEKLRAGFSRLKTPWTVEPAHELLDLPGVGLCVPDLVFSHRESGRRVCLEVMGYWSRDAVWRRVELVQAGLPQPMIFALSSRLRVSESVLDDSLPSQLYVYKGTMSAKVVAARLDALLNHDDSGTSSQAHS